MLKNTILIFLFLICSCAKQKIVTPSSALGLKGWRYQLQNLGVRSLKKIEDGDHLLWVIDYSKDGSDDQAFTLTQIKSLKRNNNFICAYLSLGEAEDYRFYFKNLNRSLLVSANTNWHGNFPVRFWEKEWKEVVQTYLKKIISAGFDGVFFDVVDVFHTFKEEKGYAEKMAHLIVDLHKYSLQLNPNFKIFLQNGGDIIHYLNKDTKELLLAAIQGLSFEGVIFNYQLADLPFLNNEQVEENMKFYQQQGKWVFSLEYPKNNQQIDQYINKIKKIKGVFPLATDKDLKGQYFWDH